MTISLWGSLKQEKELNNQRLIFQSQILERSITRTLESVESSILSLETIIPQRPLDSEHLTWLTSLRERIDHTLYFAPHIRQILVLKEKSVLIDSAGRSEGKTLDTQHIQLDQHRHSRSSNGLIILGSIDQRFVPMTDQV
ncbi:hypothetical protein [Nitrincola tibetensis]|uniref:hypothetical protein n=1 Tax=Nitrincola tibetensis TaxID=2219697 RepID=UPI00105830AA|nr:hypothetical protein [Nitrincola tibetensis]